MLPCVVRDDEHVCVQEAMKYDEEWQSAKAEYLTAKAAHSLAQDRINRARPGVLEAGGDENVPQRCASD